MTRELAAQGMSEPDARAAARRKFGNMTQKSHAAQGAGELTGDALETSMEFTFSVDLIKGHAPSMPRAENADYRMASGIANSLPEALQQATTNLSQWLAADYKLTPNEIALVLGTAIHYDVAEVVDPLVHVVARIDKKALARLGPN